MFRQNRTRIYNTILGYYQYDNTFFDTLIVPEFLNKELLINEIIVQAGLLETAYTDGDLLKKLIGLWSVSRSEDWERMYNALYSEYVPIHNYDKHSTIDNTGQSSVESGNVETGMSGKQSHTDDVNVRTDNLTEKTDNINDIEYNSRDTRTDNLTNTRTDNLSETHGGGETTTHENTAYNAGLTATSRDILQRNGDVVSNTGTQTNANTGTQTNAKTGNDTETLDETKRNTGTQTDDRDIDYTETATDSRTQTGNSLKNDKNNMTEYTFGNIGVKTTQSMIVEELELRVKYNIYELIATEFKEKFCNLIYAL